MFQIMDEDVNSDELWFALLILSSACEIGTERVRKVLDWLEGGGHELEEVLEDYVSELNTSRVNENDYDVTLILALCPHLGLDVRAQSWTTDGGKVAQKISPLP